ncbi:Tetratricopeptide-like helical [Artemisia annua]|uniref:Tetratricopeptide-like helical n=1 Tax=Artemisia annua TaxID=35608 RepID=A0A2U1KFE4_ARTAN|nr:Tetratricopeptide-like helical [Artemisia annua]
MDTGSKQVFDRDEYVGKTNKSRFVKSERVSFNMNNRNFDRSWESDDDLADFDFGASSKQRRTGEYFQQEQGKYRVNGNNMLYDDMESTNKETYDESRNGNGFASSPSSEMSNDLLFNEYVTEANGLLKEAREWLTHRGIEEDAENMLYKSTELLSKAVDMKPMSLVAVGQLGNTYLLHGELKLKLSRKLRGILAQSDSNVLDDEFSNREKFVDYLVNVCEECEELLVKAGRKYRLALSIDGDDMRALYNWGLALSFRAQLIADIGPEAAFDADKVYMAAIDKFDAMMSKSNSHTTDALFRWGVALQQRSRLRTRNFREKVKLLSQAKRLYEDALLMDSSNLQVKEALSTCVSELRYKNYY